MSDAFQVGIATLTSLAVGVGAGWFLAQVVGQRIAHRYRLVEEHSKAFMKYVEKLYMPYLAWGGLFIEHLKENPLDEEGCFFDLVQFLKTGDSWQRECGGLFFVGDLVGEYLFVSLDYEVTKALDRIFGRKALHEILAETEAVSNLSQWTGKLQQGGLLNRPFTTFQKWLSGPDRTSLVLPLRCALDVLSFEVNWFARGLYETEPIKPPALEERAPRDLVRRLMDASPIQPKEKERYMKKIGLPPC